MVQTHLSAPPDLLIQKTFILFPLRRRRRKMTMRRKSGRREEERGRVGNVGEHKQLIKHSDSDPPLGVQITQVQTERHTDRQAAWEGQRRRHMIGQIT